MTNNPHNTSGLTNKRWVDLATKIKNSDIETIYQYLSATEDMKRELNSILIEQRKAIRNNDIYIAMNLASRVEMVINDNWEKLIILFKGTL
ncbi:hypothetical protein JW979_09965 [bacterium]|nr:hypothetical protein [candidate division CSSED10-310 bacterium]